MLRSTLQQIEWIIVRTLPRRRTCDAPPHLTHAPRATQVNDGSTKHLDKLDPYRSMPRVRVIDLPKNRGLPGARNAAIRAARAPYIFNLDTDDFVEPTFLEKAVWFLESHPQFALVNAWSIGFGYKRCGIASSCFYYSASPQLSSSSSSSLSNRCSRRLHIAAYVRVAVRRVCVFRCASPPS